MQANRTYQSSANAPAELPAFSASGPRGTLYLATEDASVQSAVARIARSLGLRVSSLSTLREFTHQFEHNQPSSLLIDNNLPTLRRNQVEQEVRKLSGATPIILLLDHPDIAATVRVVRAGAVAVLKKPPVEDALREAISQAMNESSVIQSKMKEVHDFQRRLSSLSSGQRAVLDLVLDGLANKSIARILKISIRTVEMRRSRIYKCLNIDSVVQLVRRCIAAKYIEP